MAPVPYQIPQSGVGAVGASPVRPPHILPSLAAVAAIASGPVRRHDYPRAVVALPDGTPHVLPQGAKPRDMPASYWDRLSIPVAPGAQPNVNTAAYWASEARKRRRPATVASRFNAVHKVLGKGGFGSVFLAEKKGVPTSESLVAVKIISKESFYNGNKFDASKAEEIAKEIDLLRFFSYPGHQPWFRSFFPNFVEAFQTNGHVAMVMEYCVGDLFDLSDYVGPMPWVFATFYLAQIAKALSLIHEQDLLFRDLKTENVFIDMRGHCKIGDFGLALDLRKGKRDRPLDSFVEKEGSEGVGTAFLGNEFLMAPERRRHQVYWKQSDWYSLGIIAFELATSDRDSILPFESVCDPTRDPASYDTAPLLPTANDISRHALGWDAVSIIRGLTAEDPGSRWGFWDVMQAPTLCEHFQGDMKSMKAPYNLLQLRAAKELGEGVPGKGMSERELGEHLAMEPPKDIAFMNGVEKLSS